MEKVKQKIEESIADIMSTQEEMQSMLKQTDKRIAELKQMASTLTAPSRIRVPDNIKFELFGGELALLSPNYKCILSGNYYHGGIPNIRVAGYTSDSLAEVITDPLYLEPCKREDLKCGDVCFGTDGDEDITNFGAIKCYGVVLNSEQSVHWEDKDFSILTRNIYWKSWYKVVHNNT